MIFNVLAIRRGSDSEDKVLYPILNDKSGAELVALEEDDGQNIFECTATSIGVHDQSPDGSSLIAELSDVHAEIYVTNSRVVIACEDYATASEWNVADKLRAIVVKLGTGEQVETSARSRRGVLVGHIRYPWLAGVGAISSTDTLSQEKVRIFYSETESAGNEGKFLELTLSQGGKAVVLAEEIFRRSVPYRLACSDMPSDKRTEFEQLSHDSGLIRKSDNYAYRNVPMHFRIGTSITYLHSPKDRRAAALLSAVRQRIIGDIDQNDHAFVLAHEAAMQATELLRLVPEDSSGPISRYEVVRAVAWLYWLRFKSLPERKNRPALDAAVPLFIETLRLKSEEPHVPDFIRELIDDGYTGRGDSPPEWAATAFELLQDVQERFDPTALSQAIELLYKVIKTIPDDHPKRSSMLSDLAGAFQLKYERTGDRRDLREAARFADAAMGIADPGNLDVAQLVNSATVLVAQSDQTSDVTDLDEAISRLRSALAIISGDDVGREMVNSNLSQVLRRRFELTGELADLSASIAAARDALDGCQSDGADRPMFLSALGSGLLRRFVHFRDLEDLREAVTVCHEATDSTDPSSHDWPLYASNLAHALQLKYEESRKVNHISEAISYLEKAIAKVSRRHPSWIALESNLSLAYAELFDSTGSRQELDKAIAAGRQAQRSKTASPRERAAAQANLGRLLRQRYELAGGRANAADIRDAITSGEAAVREAADTADRSEHLANLALSFQARFAARKHSDDHRDAEAAIQLFREVAQTPTASAFTRLNSARMWGSLAAALRRWTDAVDGYAEAIRLLPLLAWPGMHHGSSQKLIAEQSGLAADAAACAIAAGLPDRAIELIEDGRTVLWSQLLEIRGDLADLEEAAPALVARLTTIRARLDGPVSGSRASSAAWAEPRSEPGIDQRIAWSQEWNALLKEARHLPGFSRFLLPPRASELRQAVIGGAVVVVNVSQWRCDALIVTNTGIRTVELPNLTHRSATDYSSRHLGALAVFRELPSQSRIRTLDDSISKMLVWLWDTIAEPILDSLGHRRTPLPGEPWPQIWWCPVGPLTLLPLHAAGHHERHGTSPRTVLDRAISSYTPTLRMLAKNRAALRTSAQRKMLIVALPATPGQVRLSAVDRERDFLMRLFPDQHHELLYQEAATREGVQSALNRNLWAHLSCHGQQDLDEPRLSGLALYDGSLSVGDLAAENQQAEFVFISACSTALGGVQVPDESITLSTAMQYSGWCHVIATLWEVWDKAAGEVAELVYPQLTDHQELHPDNSALALHNAMRKIRERAGETRPSFWAPFLHSGP